jgi:uncharacterized protein (TIGR00725 family)
MATQKTVTIFGSSRPSPGEQEYKIAYELGRLLAIAGYTVCNGGYGGTMEAAARGAKEAGGSTIGVTMEFVSTEANPWIDKTIVVKTLVDRLLRLIELGDAYVVLRGGTGTLLELASVWELMNKKVIPEKPMILLGDFWSATVETVKKELTIEGLEWSSHHVTLVRDAEECVRLVKERLR